MTRSRWGLVGLGVAFFLYTVAAARVGFAPYDDGVFGYGGWSVAHGRLPYRDFWTLYNPGQFLIIGAFFRYVSDSVLALRIFESMIVAGAGALAYDVCRRLYGNRVIAIAASSLLVLWLGAGSALYPFHENHTLTSLFLVLLSVDLLLLGATRAKARWFALAGLAAGACFVIRQDAAPYVIVPEIVAIAALPLFLEQDLRSAGRRALAYAGGALVPIGAMLAWVLSYAPRAYWDQAVVFPIKSNPGLRELPYSFSALDFSTEGGLVESLYRLARSAREGFFFYLPFLIALFAIALVVIHVRRRGPYAIPNMWGYGLVSILLLASLDYSRVRSDFDHMFWSILVSFIVVPGVVVVAAAAAQTTGARRLALVGGGIVAVFALLIPISARLRVMQGLREGVHLSSGPLAGLVIDNRDNGGSSDWERVDAAAAYIASNTSRDDRIFVSGAQNDRAIRSNPVFYLMAERTSATVNAELYPGVTTTEQTQRRIVSELRDTNTRYVIKWPFEEPLCSEPNLACSVKGSRVLDDFIDTHYENVMRFDALEILRGSPFPRPSSESR
jgi:hypothetical protein